MAPVGLVRRLGRLVHPLHLLQVGVEGGEEGLGGLGFGGHEGGKGSVSGRGVQSAEDVLLRGLGVSETERREPGVGGNC